MKYIKEVYLISDEKFIVNEFLSFSDKYKEICNEEIAIKYMALAKEFWNKRNISAIMWNKN